MGQLFLAEDDQLKRQVAIKCLPAASYSPQALHQIRREASTLAQLNHPNVVQIYDLVEDQGQLALVMELVEGTSLKSELRESAVNPEQALSWLLQIAEGLENAHRLGIVHCDLKADNILLTADQRIKIIDFGIARTLSQQNISENGEAPALGSYHSLSPEQARGEPVDFRTDIFAFGLLMYQMLRGRHPFKGADPAQTMRRIARERFEFSAADRALLSADWIELISSLLEPRPEERPASIRQVAQRLKILLDDQSGEDQQTRELPDASVPAQSFGSGKLAGLAMVAIIAVAASIFFYHVKSADNSALEIAPTYALLLPVELAATADLSEDRQRLLRLTLRESVQEAVLKIDHLNLIVDRSQEEFSGNFEAYAHAMAADTLLRTTADCTAVECQINLQRLEGEKWTLAEQRSWPVLVEPMTQIRASVLSALPRLFGDDSDPAIQAISEAHYQAFLTLSQATHGGATANAEQLRAIEDLLLKAPTYLPAYVLFSQATQALLDETGSAEYEALGRQVLMRAPSDLRAEPELLELAFFLETHGGNLQEAQKLVDSLWQTGSHPILANRLSATLAYQAGNYLEARERYQKIALLRPSYLNFYNLAVTEFTLGELDAAGMSINQALALAPNVAYLRNLVGAIELAQGDLGAAIQTYRRLVEQQADSYNLSNLGLALMLSGDYSAAIDNHRAALALNSDRLDLQINLADSMKLAGEINGSTDYYQRVLRQTESPKTPNDYNLRAQAFAHLSDYNSAIKTLRLADQALPDSPEQAYSAALVNSLSGDLNAAVVDVEKSLELGMGAIWFHLPWFQPLCTAPLFSQLVAIPGRRFCTN